MPKSELRIEAEREYAPVAVRITRFYERYPAGRIVTELVSREERAGAVEVTFRASVYRASDDQEPAATGWASEREGDGEINAVACLENTETSAIGRALANLGFTAAPTRPSQEEMAKVTRAHARIARARADRESLAADPLQRHAEAVRDALELVERAEREGLRPRHAGALRKWLLAATPSLDGIHRIERRLRGWLSWRRRRL